MHQQPGRTSTTVFILLLCLFAAPVILAWSALAVGQQAQSYEENRTLTQFPTLTAKSFLDGSFQEQFENALADQVPGGAAVKSTVLGIQDPAARTGKELIYAMDPTLRTSYEQITAGYYHYQGDSHRIVERPSDWMSMTEKAESFAAQWAGETAIPKYLYFVENSRSINFDDTDPGHQISSWIAQYLGAEQTAVFRIDSYEAYCERFYQTDHHWNLTGSYEAYQSIIRMLCGEDEVLLKPTGTVQTSAIFQGSYARQTRELCADQAFSFYTFDTPKRMKVNINGKKGTYGHMTAYEKGKYPTDELRNHYAYCYGGDYAQVEFISGSQGKGTLLVIANSYSNVLDPLIASHFDRTLFVDPRYYADWAGAPFDLNAYCQKEGVDKVLYLSDIAMFMTDEAAKGGDAE